MPSHSITKNASGPNEKVIEGQVAITVDKLRVRENIVDVDVPKFVEKEVIVERPRYVEKDTVKYITREEDTVRYVTKEEETVKYVPREEEVIKPVIVERQYERPVVIDKQYERPIVKEDKIEVSRIVDLHALKEMVTLVKELNKELPLLRDKLNDIRNYRLVEETVKVPKMEYITVQVERIEWIPVKKEIQYDGKDR